MWTKTITTPAGSLSIGELRKLDRSVIRGFVEAHAGLLQMRTLDWGSGAQPYRALCGERGYVAFDPHVVGSENYPDRHDFEAVLSTVSLQEMRDPAWSVAAMIEHLVPTGHLLIVYHPNWREVETADRWRFSMSGMVELVEGMDVIWHEPLLAVSFGDFSMNFTCGMVARKPCR
jgi:hypothetical protein